MGGDLFDWWFWLVPDDVSIVRIDGGFGFHGECGLIGGWCVLIDWYWVWGVWFWLSCYGVHDCLGVVPDGECVIGVVPDGIGWYWCVDLMVAGIGYDSMDLTVLMGLRYSYYVIPFP